MANPELERMATFEYLSPIVAKFNTDPIQALSMTEKKFGEIKLSEVAKIYQRATNDVPVSNTPMLDTFRSKISLLVDSAWKKVQALTGTTRDFSPQAKLYAGYTAAALMGALILFGVYKLIKWVLPKKEENTVKEFEENCVGFWSNLKEGESFVSTLSQKLREDASESTTDKILNKAKGVADEASVFIMEADTKKKTEKSVIKKYAYILLSGLVSLAAVFVYWYYYKGQLAKSERMRLNQA